MNACVGVYDRYIGSGQGFGVGTIDRIRLSDVCLDFINRV